MKRGLILNLELKNSVVAYDGMEEKVLRLISERGLNEKIIYSSFNARSIEKIKTLNSDAHTAILDIKVSDCMYKLRGGCGADALHPFWRAMLPCHSSQIYNGITHVCVFATTNKSRQ